MAKMTSEVRQRQFQNGKHAKFEDIPDPVKPWDPFIDGIRWIENHAALLEKLFDRVPEVVNTIVGTLSLITFGAILRGEWVIILVAVLKQASGQTQASKNSSSEEISELFTLEKLKLENFFTIFVVSHAVSFSMYFLVGGFLHWYYYINKRHLAREWKIQPNKWLTPELERHEIRLGTLSLFCVGSFSSFLATYIYNGNPCSVYFQISEYGWLWFFMQFPVIFIYMDYTTYILHRLYHTRFFYKYFHKYHHTYKQPTVFSVTAMHPLELLHIQATIVLPLFAFPVHWFAFYSVAMYNYIHGILDHSGVNFTAQWWQPWQPDSDFHDKHHEFFHCNFGFNMTLWDKLHGTCRKQNHLYTENTYHGEAKPIDSAEVQAIIQKSPELKEIVEDILEADRQGLS